MCGRCRECAGEILEGLALPLVEHAGLEPELVAQVRHRDLVDHVRPVSRMRRRDSRGLGAATGRTRWAGARARRTGPTPGPCRPCAAGVENAPARFSRAWRCHW